VALRVEVRFKLFEFGEFTALGGFRARPGAVVVHQIDVSQEATGDSQNRIVQAVQSLRSVILGIDPFQWFQRFHRFVPFQTVNRLNAGGNVYVSVIIECRNTN
jgi:hypothetical protein